MQKRFQGIPLRLCDEVVTINIPYIHPEPK
jgi:hypothetical protein